MKLKRVKVFGFKTFADKTEIDLDGNIIAVVGPNGCGKSNIVDAILWGLGESHAKSLRAATSKEVIFAGSLHRKQLGFAEVSLLFDNEDGTLPLDSPEVLVSRKINRAGESEYSINRRTCRLRDVNDLLADSGLGRAGYAIVGQSEIDQALAASAQQRRAWIDEAAGVQRYRARRTEAIRRLEHAGEHLTRLGDILTEIETQKGPLALEAEVARQYKQLQASLKEIECGLLIKDLHLSVAELDGLADRIASAQKIIAAEGDRCLDAELKIEANQAKIVEIEEALERLRGEQTAAQSQLDHALATLQVAEHKLENISLLESSLTEESEAGQARLDQAAKDLETTKQEEAIELAKLDQLKTDLSGVGEEASRLKQALRQIEHKLSEARLLMAKRQRLEVEMAHRDERAKHVKLELKGIVSTLPELEVAVAEAQAEFNAQEFKLQAVQARLAETEAQKRTWEGAAEREGAQRRGLLAELATLDGRRRGLEATIDAHEGLAQGSKAVLLAAERGELAGEFHPVGSLIRVSTELALALDTALGAAANDLVVQDEQVAKRAVEHLKRHRLGRATFQPLVLMRPSLPSSDLQNVLKDQGIVGLASDLVQCEPRFLPVIQSLLGRVMIARDLDAALRLAKTRGWSRIVTLEGEVVHSSGAVTGGTSHRPGAGMVQRKAELAELEGMVDKLQRDLSAIDDGSEGIVELKRKVAEQGQAAANDLKLIKIEHDDARTWLLNIRHELATTLKSQEKLELELRQLLDVDPVEVPTVELTSLEEEKDELLKQVAAKSNDAESAQDRLREADGLYIKSRQRRIEAERRSQNLAETERLRTHKSEALEPERQRCYEAIRVANGLQQSESQRITDLRETIFQTAEARRTLSLQMEAWREEARSAEKIVSVTSQTIHQAEVQKARADSRRVATVERLLEEYGVNQEAGMEMEIPAGLPEDSSQIVTKLRKDIRTMGDVNVGAIDAYDRLNDRFQELDVQVQDVLAGKVEIESSVRELDRLTSDRFSDTFSMIQASFAKMFSRIFGGGEGALSLTDHENILESGVDIQVTIPGKKRQRLELLSGGERAMSALAFLFALLEVKPSPLVILDEVDAPLDSRNVERFISTMRDFNDQTQFILITHNPVTIESADVWFGVTMQEPGVSTLVPFKVPERRTTTAVVLDTLLKG